MSQDFILSHGEEMVQCPYNPSHLVTNVRLLTHLHTCRKQYLKNLSNSERRRVMRICRHNAEHHIPAIELPRHEEVCTSADSVIRHMAYHNSEEGNRAYQERQRQDAATVDTKQRFTPNDSGRKETKPNVSNNWGLEEEDWETETANYQPGYDPTEKLKTQPVLCSTAGLAPAERKKFRKEVREKAAEISVTGRKVEFPIGIRYEEKPDIKLLKLDDDMKDEPQYKHEMTDYARHSATSKRDPDNDSHYFRSSSSRDRDFNSRSSGGDRDRYQRRSSTKDRDDNHPSSSRKDRDRDNYYPRNHSPDHDSYYSRRPDNNSYHSKRPDNDSYHSKRQDNDSYHSRRPDNDNSRSKESINYQSTSASSSRESYSGKSQRMNGENISNTTWIRRENENYTVDDFEGYDPFTKGGCKN